MSCKNFQLLLLFCASLAPISLVPLSKRGQDCPASERPLVLAHATAARRQSPKFPTDWVSFIPCSLLLASLSSLGCCHFWIPLLFPPETLPLFLRKWSQADFLPRLASCSHWPKLRADPVTQRSDAEREQWQEAWNLTKPDHVAPGKAAIPKAACCGDRNRELTEYEFYKIAHRYDSWVALLMVFSQITITDHWLANEFPCPAIEQVGPDKKNLCRK